MDINLNININGYFSYKIYRKTPDNIIYESKIRKNLIVDTGLAHLYSKSIIDAIQVIDFGISGDAPTQQDVGLKGSEFVNAETFNDLRAIYLTGGPVTEKDSVYTAFFRSRTTSSPVTLREFVIKPGPGENAFARQIFDPISLEGGDGIEFTYEVKVEWPCELINSTSNLIVNTERLSPDIPTNWITLSGSEYYNNKVWSKIISDKANNLIAIADSGTILDLSEDSPNVIYSTDKGETWSAASPLQTAPYNLNKSLRAITLGNIPVRPGDSVTSHINRFVAVGRSGSAFYSDNISEWILIDNTSSRLLSSVSWAGIAYAALSSNSSEFSFTPTYVAVGPSRGMISNDGISWSNLQNPILTATNNNWTAITYGNTFVAVCSNAIAYSNNGVNWLSARPPAQINWTSLVYDNNNKAYVAVSKGFERYAPIMYALESDLSKWYPVNTYMIGSWEDVTYYNNIFLAVGRVSATDDNPEPTNAIYSTDGTDWFLLPGISSLPSNVPWKSITYIDDTVISVALSAPYQGHIFTKSKINLASNKTLEIPVKTVLLSKPPGDRIIQSTYPMYTLSGMNMPSSCSTSFIINEPLYSSTLQSNSYTLPKSTLLFPNTAVLTYDFTYDVGHGAIKNLIIANEVSEDGLPLSGIWGFELDVPRQEITLNTTVRTGEENNIVEITPASGSLFRDLVDPLTETIDSRLTFNVYFTWGTDRSEIAPALNGSPSYALINIPPGWDIVNIDDYNEIYRNSVKYPIALYKTSVSDSIEAEIGCPPLMRTIIDYRALTIEIKTKLLTDRIQRRDDNNYDILSKISFLPPAINTYTRDRLYSVLRQASNETSAANIEFFNNISITPYELINLFNESSNACIGQSIVEDIYLIPNSNKMKIFFKNNITFTPDYVTVASNNIFPIGTCSLSSINYAYIPTLTSYNVLPISATS